MKYNVEIDSSGNQFYYINKVLDREDGPAAEYTDGTKVWYKNGQWHREDGPAYQGISAYKEWCLNGKCYGYNDQYTIESWKKFVKTLIFS